jgi:ATP-dependent Clp protease ATP-binding subunit ClpA
MDFKASGGGSHVQEIHQEGHQGHCVVQEEVLQLGHNFLGMEQIFLGLISDRTGIAAKVLKSMVVNLKDAPIEVEKIIG